MSASTEVVQPTWVCADSHGNPYFFCTNHWYFYALLKDEIRGCRRRGGDVQLLEGAEAQDAMHRAKTYWPEGNPCEAGYCPPELMSTAAYFRVAPDYPHI